MRRFSVLLLALLATLGPAASVFAQSAETIAITDVNTTRYDEDGKVTMVVEFRNIAEAIDLSQVGVTVNGEPVEGATVERIANEAVPVGVVLLIDSSGSMEGAAIEAAKAAAKGFVDSKRPEDFIAVVTFASQVTVVSNFSNRSDDLKQRIDGIVAEGDTALYDGVIKAAELYGSSDQIQRNLIILSDGANDLASSTTTLQNALDAIASAKVRTFGVALESAEFNPADVQAMAQAGNGLFLSTPDPTQLDGLYGQIRRELGNTVVVRFNSPVFAPGDAEFGVTYGALTATAAATVPGFVTTTTAGPAPTTTFPRPPGSIVVNELPLPASTLRWLAVGGITATIGLFAFILLGALANNEEDKFAKRLSAYGRRGQGEEKRSILQRIPLLGRFTAAAEEEVRRRGLLGAVNSTLEQGNIPLSAGEAIAAGFGLAGVVGFIVGLVTLNPLAGVIAAAVMVLIVFGIINFVGGREKKKFEKQLPDTLTLTSTSLRAGYSLLQAVEAVAQEAPSPTAREFQRAIAEARLGRPVTEALNGITHRTQSKDFEWAVLAIEIQREVGGNLAEVLQTVADTMLARNRLKGEIRALTAEGRISAYVLGSLPFALGSFLWVSNRTYLEPLFQETVGRIAIGMGITLMLAGWLWLRKIVNIEV
jgi:tight adherence protein B